MVILAVVLVGIFILVLLLFLIVVIFRRLNCIASTLTETSSKSSSRIGPAMDLSSRLPMSPYTASLHRNSSLAEVTTEEGFDETHFDSYLETDSSVQH